MSAYRCHTCAATFTAWAPSERHSDAEHHHRIELELVIDQRTGGAMPKKSILKDRRDGEKRMGPPRPTEQQPTPAPKTTRRRNQ